MSHAQQYNVSFCVEPRDKNSKKNQKFREGGCLDCPIFNVDRNHATPTFILPSEKVNMHQFRAITQKKAISCSKNINLRWLAIPMRSQSWYIFFQLSKCQNPAPKTTSAQSVVKTTRIISRYLSHNPAHRHPQTPQKNISLKIQQLHLGSHFKERTALTAISSAQNELQQYLKPSYKSQCRR